MKNKILLTISLTVFGLTSSIAQLPNYVPANGLVGWWPFDGNANDQTINANNGTISGAILTVDRFGNSNAAYSFNFEPLLVFRAVVGVPKNFQDKF